MPFDAPTRSARERGYGQEHRRKRAALIADLKANPGKPCSRCGQPMYVEQSLHLDHTDRRDGYRGLSHAKCNLRAAAQKGHQRAQESIRRRILAEARPRVRVIDLNEIARSRNW